VILESEVGCNPGKTHLKNRVQETAASEVSKNTIARVLNESRPIGDDDKEHQLQWQIVRELDQKEFTS
jgi:hypothetical protein